MQNNGIEDVRVETATTDAPDHTAVRVALWRALHVELDAPPHVLVDELGLWLAAPDDGWRRRPDMDPEITRVMRASIVARARFVEDLVAERGAPQYAILGAGLDTFAQRHSDPGIAVFEIDRPGTQAWKRRRLAELGLAAPAWLHFVPVDFEAGDPWWPRLVAAGFDPARPAVVASTGVSMYLTRETNAATLRQLAGALAPGSTLAMTFMIPRDLVADPTERQICEFAERGARASGTPFISFYAPDEIVAAARAAGFRDAFHVSADELAARYFANRADGLRPASVEQLLVAST
jgi:methyltransferase (TIGR00027 family)